MKIAVYTICKNEEQFLTRWVQSCQDADYILIVDTGSSDQTVEKAKQIPMLINRVETVNINPWRFDDARNFSLNLLPDDIDVCICLDMDEVLVEGWREKIEAACLSSCVDRLRYNYVWSWNNDGSPALTYYADKIHRRHGYRWVNPVHEVLVKDLRLGSENQYFINDTLIEHYPDTNKSRSSYLGLLELAVKENPNNDRNAHYYARDLMFDEQYQKAIDEFQRHLTLPTATWKPERAASMRYLGDCYWALGETDYALHYFDCAINEAPNEREAYISLAQAYRALGNYEEVKKNCELALAIVEKPNSYINQPWAWSDWPDVMLNEAINKLQGDK